MPPEPRPLLALAIPTYQHGHTLPQALDSILASPRASEVEIVISNNASTDDTAEVVAGYVARYPNVRALTQPENVSFDENLARAMESCSARYIWTMSSDDALVEGALDHVLDILGSLERDTILLGNWWIANGALKLERIRHAVHRDRLLDTPRRAVPAAGLWALFMSALVLPAEPARNELSRYRGGDGLTHWKIATRLAATGTPVLEMGAPLVVQRIGDPVAPPYYDVPIVFSGNIRRHIASLQSEVGLPTGPARAVQSRMLRVVMRGFVGTAMQRWPAVGRRWFRPLLLDYWSFPAFWLWVATMYVIPRPLLRALWRLYLRMRKASDTMARRVPAKEDREGIRSE